MKIKFWGVRGSVPCATDHHLQFGGNTSCVTVEHDGEIVVLDAGTGMVPLGKEFVSRGIHSSTLLLSHAHLDHIFGLPFFSPAWRPDFNLKVMAGNLMNAGGVREVFDQVFGEPAFPVPVKAMRGVSSFNDFAAGDSFTVGCFKVTTIPLFHPNGATAYRLEVSGKSVCYVTDVEHIPGEIDPIIVEFIRNTDLFIYDSTYTDTEFLAKIGWGHSTWQHGVRLGLAANVKRYAMFHHDPDRTDELMARLEVEAQQTWKSAFAAREGLEIEL